MNEILSFGFSYMALIDVANLVNTLLIFARIISIIMLIFGGFRIAGGDIMGGLLTLCGALLCATSYLITTEFFGLAGSGLPSVDF